jgi:hypothetical protein
VLSESWLVEQGEPKILRVRALQTVKLRPTRDVLSAHLGYARKFYARRLMPNLHSLCTYLLCTAPQHQQPGVVQHPLQGELDPRLRAARTTTSRPHYVIFAELSPPGHLTFSK